jgi:hypothetical protein
MEIKYPKFTLGWEFESIADVNGNESRDEQCSHCSQDCDCGSSEPGCDECYCEGPDVNDRAGIKEIEIHRDGSVHGAGLEYVLRKDFVYEPSMGIHALWKLLKMTGVQTDKSCGFHVHVGLPMRSSKQLIWAGWFQQLGRLIEEKAFLAVPESRRTNSYCHKIGKAYPLSTKHWDREKYSNSDRYQWVNVVEMFRPDGIRTVEIRLLGNVRRFAYLASWIAFCHQMAKSAWTLSHDVSYLEVELQRLNVMVDAITEYMLPRIHESNRLIRAYNMLENVGINMRPEIEYTLVSLRTTEKYIAYDIAEEEKRKNRLQQASSNSLPFQVGDKVKCIDAIGQLIKGATYTVRNIDETYVQLVNVEGMYYNTRFVLVERADKSEGYCDGSNAHWHSESAICVVCSHTWGRHRGHYCPSGTIGRFLESSITERYETAGVL